MVRNFSEVRKRLIKYVYRHPRRPPPRPDEDEILSAGKQVAAKEAKRLEPHQIDRFFKSITAPNSEGAKGVARKGSESFQQLVLDAAHLPAPDSTTAAAQLIKANDGVDKLLEAFRHKTTPLLPRIEILNEALQFYVEAGQLDRAHRLFLEMLDGVRPNNATLELVAAAYQKAGKRPQSLEVLESLPNLTAASQAVYHDALRELFRENKDAEAWRLFDRIRLRGLPSPAICSTMIFRCGKLDQVEKAFLLHKELSHQGMTANAQVYTALICAASRRKEYYPMAIELFRQMELFKMTIGITVYDSLLYGCSKVADLHTAMGLWKTVMASPDPTLRPTIYTCTNYIWALASIESTRGFKLSKRDFAYDLDCRDLVNAAEEVYVHAKEKLRPVSPQLMSAMLAIYSNNRRVQLAEELFWREHDQLAIKRSPFAYELMFKLYDNVAHYEGAVRVHQQLQQDKLKIPYEGWRALARCAALTDHLEEALQHVKEMAAQGYKPALSDLKHVNMRFLEREREDLSRALKSLCVNEGTFAPNPFVPWLNRSQAVSSLLTDVYGKNAPGCASKIVVPAKR